MNQKLPKKFIEEQKVALEKEKVRLEGEIKKLKAYPDYGDIGEDNEEELRDFENNMSIENQLEFLLEKVKKALSAIEKGTYGTCLVCKNQIENGRLEIMPYADICVQCSKKK